MEWFVGYSSIVLGNVGCVQKFAEIFAGGCTESWKLMAKVARPSRLNICGSGFWRRRWRQVHPTCSTRIIATGNPTNRTWAPGNK